MKIICKHCFLALDYEDKEYSEKRNGYRCPRCKVEGPNIFVKNDLNLPSLPFNH